ncbi:sortilin-related receptor-like [Halyomorpha halys]|uniref:sortilin-related receptor-like n=1 Tax=Halyomorpha halys TaxID=286706 RepID=UPI0034D1FB3F
MYEKWALIFAFIISASHCITLSVDESLRPKDSYFVINQLEETGIKETIDQHVIQKRSANPTSNITVNPTDLKDNHRQILVHWAGNDSNVFICLTRNIDSIVPTKKPTPSAVYVSYDYGVNFKNLTDSFALDSNGSYASVEKFYNHPRNQHYMVFLDKYNQMFFVTKNYGTHITKVKPSFQPMEILFYPEDPFIFLAYDVNKTVSS